jgi:PAS domain S-box-containing protein
MLEFGGILAIADALPVMIAYVDPNQRYLFANKPIADWFERPRGDILGRTMREVMGEANYALREDTIAAALKGTRHWFAAAYDHPTRGPLFAQAEYIPHTLPDGTVAGIIMVIQDITEARAAEIALRESEARFRRIADSAPTPVWVTRLDRSRDFVNDAYAEFLGVDREAARLFDWSTIIHPDDHDRIVATSIAGQERGEAFELTGRYRRHDGEYRWMHTVSQPRHDADGRVVGFIGVASDITLAKQAELDLRRLVEERTAELTESEQRFRAIFDAVMVVIVLLKPDGTVIEINNTRAAWRSQDTRRVVGRPLWESPTLERYPGYEDLIRQAVATAASGEIFTDEVKFEAPGQPTAHLDLTMQPVRGARGEIRYLLFEVRDITELKSAQEQLRQSQKMEALGQLTGGIAHDFNNLLTVVVGGLDLITKRTDDSKIRRYAENALSAAERGARLTAQLLAFSRVQRLEVRPTYVAPLIENMRHLLRNVLGPGIDKQFDLNEELIPVMADPTQLELAVLNLAINARDAMPDGGTLFFETRKESIHGDPELDDGNYVELSIRDTGTGMTPEVMARAFEPFFTTKEVGKGTGLGLSMVYGVARQSGGTARIESEVGEGTTVKLYFRHAEGAGPNAEADGAAAEARAMPKKKASVLVIDDDPDVREFIATSLAECGFAVREAADGAAGLESFEKKPPDLVVLDFVMPGMSGAEVANRMLAERPGQPILFVSGFSETEAIRRLAPDTPLLAKPFRADALDAAVRSALGIS